jgi:hydroxymethylpyrimidine/phosphomethylpyrimidine kinase
MRMSMSVPTALTIAGSDSSGGAGIQADLRTFEAVGVRGVSAVTAVTAQNARGVAAIAAMPADLVTAQIEAVAAGGEIAATKIGMLANAAIAEAVAAAIQELDLPLVVLDPVLASTSGTRLLDNDGVQVLIAELLPRSLVVTPNVPEAEALSGRRIRSRADLEDAARRIHAMGAGHVVIKGGHLPPQSDARASARGAGRMTRQGRRRAATEWIVDLLFDGRQFKELKTPRVQNHGMRGSGCAYASALAACLALGDDLLHAAARAQRHVARLIARTYTE